MLGVKRSSAWDRSAYEVYEVNGHGPSCKRNVARTDTSNCLFDLESFCWCNHMTSHLLWMRLWHNQRGGWLSRYSKLSSLLGTSSDIVILFLDLGQADEMGWRKTREMFNAKSQKVAVVNWLSSYQDAALNERQDCPHIGQYCSRHQHWKRVWVHEKGHCWKRTKTYSSWIHQARSTARPIWW